jgi:Polyketide cyclase / dehydrase and lipid transport
MVKGGKLTMVKVEEKESIRCSPEKFLDFVMDVERYIDVDDKIERIVWVRREDNLTEFKFQPRMPGMRMPEPPAISQLRLTPGERIDIALAPWPQNKFNHRIARFRASFACEPAGDRTTVTRVVSFQFIPLVRWFFEPILRRNLPASVRRELRLAKEVLEST